MSETAMEKRKASLDGFSLFTQKNAQIGRLYKDFVAEAYQDGTIEAKYKRLMALVGALVSNCECCILAQTARALELEASVEEILEACAVALSLGGTMSDGPTTLVLRFLEESGVLE